MATNEVVERFGDHLKPLAEYLDRSLNGLQLCMIYQTTSAVNTLSWTLCVCADELDDWSERKALSYVIDAFEKLMKPTTPLMLERVVILKSYDPQAEELLSLVRITENGYLLTGKMIFGREIARAQVFFVRRLDQKHSQRQTLRA